METSYERAQAVRRDRINTVNILLNERFSEPTSIILEIGCGNGHFLTAFAEAFQEKHCIGIDILNKRVVKGERKRGRAELSNLIFLKSEATEFLEALPSHINIAETFVLFPDPWPKKRHHKNRLLQDPFLRMLKDKSTAHAPLHFRTDHEEYFDWVKNEITKHPQWNIDTNSSWPFEFETLFQKKMGAYQSLIATC